MQIVSLRENLQEFAWNVKAYSLEKEYFKMSSAEILNLHAKLSANIAAIVYTLFCANSLSCLGDINKDLFLDVNKDIFIQKQSKQCLFLLRNNGSLHDY